MTMDLKKYTKKQFADNTEYIEASPSGYPEWWRDFKMIVEDSGSINELGFNLMEFKQTDVPQWASGQIVFNPLVFDFLLHNPEYLAVFNKAHKKGAKHFKKTFFKKYPDERECKAIFEKYNNDFKNTILQGYGIFNKNVIELCGFNNGILSGYWLFESDHLQTNYKNNSKKTNIEFVPFDLMFVEPQNANLSLDKLREVYPKLLTDDYTYLKGVKGIFPMFIDSLRSAGLIKHYTDMQYKDALNEKIYNLNLTKDASEFRKTYQTVTDSDRTDLKLSLSQISQQGKTGK